MLPHPQSVGANPRIDYAQQQHQQQLEHLQAQHQGMQAAQQRMMLAQQRQQQQPQQQQQQRGNPPPQHPSQQQGMMMPPRGQPGQAIQMQQRGIQLAGPGQQVGAGQGGAMPPPPGMQRVLVPSGAGPAQGPPLPPGPIPPSHPSHPQHAAWLAQQQQQQQQQQAAHQQHLSQGPPQPHLGPTATSAAHAQHIRLQQQQQHQQEQQRRQQQHHAAFQAQTSMPPQPNGLPAHHPSAQGPSSMQPGSLPPSQHPQLSMQPPHHPSYMSLAPNSAGIAPQARSIPSNPNLRNGIPAGLQPPPNPSAASSNGPFAQPTSLPPNPSSAATPQPTGPGSQHGQSPIVARQVPQSQAAQAQGPMVAPQGMQTVARPILRAQIAATNQQASLALAAHLAVHGTGPVTATAVPTGTALSRVLALTDALTFALEDENPLHSLRTVVSDYFTDAGVVKFGLYDKTAQLSKVFEIPCSAFPRFQHLNLLHGVLSSTLSPSFIREYRLTTSDTTLQSPSSPPPPHPSMSNLPQVHIGYLLRADEAVWASRFATGTKVDLVGTLTVHLVFKDLGNGQPVLRVESFEFESRGHEEWVVREAMDVLNSVAPGGSNVANGTNGQVATTPAGSGGANSTATTTVVVKEEESNDKVSNTHSGRSSTSGGVNANSTAGQRKGMTTRRRSASAREEQHEEEESNVSSSQRGEKTGGGGGDKNKPAENAQKGNGGSGANGGEGVNPGGLKDDVKRVTARLPETSVGSFGVTEMGMRCLEISESVAQLQDLIAFSLETNTGPIQSLARYAERRRNSFAPSTPSQHASAPLPLPIPMSGPAGPQNSFYSTVGASPHPSQNQAQNYPTPTVNGVGPSMGPPLRRPSTGEGGGGGNPHGFNAGSPSVSYGGGINGPSSSSGSSGGGPGGAGNPNELMSPAAIGNGKRKLGPGPNGTGTSGAPDDDPGMNGGMSEAGSPQKMMRGGSRGRGRGR
ncbi:hypothetical protein JCM10212_003937 [Sporobolomyces blumeae]